MAGWNIRTDHDTAFPDSSTDPSIKEHQVEHDKIARVVNWWDKDATPSAGDVPRWNGSLYVPQALPEAPQSAQVSVDPSVSSAEFQAAIDEVESKGGGSVYAPAGVYHVDGLLLKEGVKVIGDGPEQTRIQAVSGSSNAFVFGLPSGPIQFTGLHGLGVEGAGNTNQHGIRLRAHRSGESSSGLWWSTFSDLRVAFFHRAQLWLEGGGTDALDPIQFNEFRNIMLDRRDDSATSLGLLLSGQVNQGIWINVRAAAEGSGASTESPGLDLKICRQLTAYDATFDGSTTYASTKAPHTHKFLMCTFENAVRGAYIDNSQSITFDTTHWEGLSSGLEVANSSNVRADDGHYANSALGAGGFSNRVSGAGQLKGDGNHFSGTYGLMADSAGGSAAINLTNSTHSVAVSTNNVTRQISSAATLDTGMARTLQVVGGTTITSLTSRLMPNEFLTIRALTAPVVLGSGGNIALAGLPSPFTIPVGKTLLLQRFDKPAAEWVAVGGTALVGP